MAMLTPGYLAAKGLGRLGTLSEPDVLALAAAAVVALGLVGYVSLRLRRGARSPIPAVHAKAPLRR
jgi:hypothetical protein